jgi:phospholipase C
MLARLVLVVALLSACGRHLHAPGSCDGPCPTSKIDHLVVIVQENHTFDSYFGRWCTAPTGSSPSCSAGPSCCEAAPDADPSGSPAIVLSDGENAAHDPSHDRACELDALDGGKMDKFVTSTICGSARNVAYADASLLKPYWDLASAGAVADRYFQPVVGQSSSNDMYLAVARFVFADNAFEPDAVGRDCSFIPAVMEFSGTTIGDLLDGRGVSWAWYIEGYQAMIDARRLGHCPTPPDACGFGLSVTPCAYDPADVPMQYYPQHRDGPHMRDFDTLAHDLAGARLPQVTFVKPVGYHSEHPGLHTTISDGVAFVSSVLAAVRGSVYADDTLVLLVYDEGGGYFDHVAPPPPSAVDNQPFGTRVPLIAIGPYAKKGAVSHVTLEHSSLVAFIEWNWLAGAVGQLAARDATAHNLGSLIDPIASGVAVPE